MRCGHDDSSLEEAAIPRQQDSLLPGRDLGEFLVARIVPIHGVEPGETEVTGELAEVGIEHEAHRFSGRRPHPPDVRDVNGQEAREDGDAIGVLDPTLEAHGFAVDQDQVDLGMRNTEALDHVLHRGPADEDVRTPDMSALKRHEVAELTIDPDGDAAHMETAPHGPTNESAVA